MGDSLTYMINLVAETMYIPLITEVRFRAQIQVNVLNGEDGFLYFARLTRTNSPLVFLLDKAKREKSTFFF